MRTCLLLCMLVLMSGSALAGTVRVNAVNSGADIAVSSSAVLVVNFNASRLFLTLANTGSAAMRCAAASDLTPTSTTGVLISAGSSLAITFNGKVYPERWYCIATATDTTMMAIEGVQ